MGYMYKNTWKCQRNARKPKTKIFSERFPNAMNITVHKIFVVFKLRDPWLTEIVVVTRVTREIIITQFYI